MCIRDRGSFQSGYCLVEQQKIVVVNKYYETEGRINVLIDILDNLTIEESTLTEKGQKTYKQVMKQKKGEYQEESKDIAVSEEVIKEDSENTADVEEVIKEESNNIDTSKEEVLDQDVEVNKL